MIRKYCTDIQVKRLVLLWILIMALIVWPLVHFKIDGLTMCVGPVVVVALNPKLEDEQREATIRHELTHVRQIHEQGCFTIIKKRWTKEGRDELEWEAIQAEIRF